MKKILLLAVTLAAILPAAVSCDDSAGSTAPPSGVNKRPVQTDTAEVVLDASVYDFVASYQEKYLRSCVTSTGCIDFRPGAGRLNPYFAEYGALGLLTNPSTENLTVVKGFLDWIFARLNGSTNPKTGGSEVPGSIYDYYMSGSTELTDGTYDSIDSYTALVLTICARLLEADPASKSWLAERTDKISLVASALVACIDTPEVTIPGAFSPEDNDCLSIAHFGYDAKYLMDNCEVNLGLRDAATLKAAGLITGSTDFEALAESNAKGIENNLWKGKMYSYYDNGSSSCNSKWTVFYPDAVAQLTPLMTGVLDPSSSRAQQLYTEFCSHFTSWQKGITAGDYPWVFVCYAAACMGDENKVNTYIQHIYSLNAAGSQKSNWYNEEAGFLLLAIDKIRNN